MGTLASSLQGIRMCWSARGDPRGVILVRESFGVVLVVASLRNGTRGVDAMRGPLWNGAASIRTLLVFKC